MPTLSNSIGKFFFSSIRIFRFNEEIKFKLILKLYSKCSEMLWRLWYVLRSTYPWNILGKCPFWWIVRNSFWYDLFLDKQLDGFYQELTAKNLLWAFYRILFPASPEFLVLDIYNNLPESEANVLLLMKLCETEFVPAIIFSVICECLLSVFRSLALAKSLAWLAQTVSANPPHWRFWLGSRSPTLAVSK